MATVIQETITCDVCGNANEVQTWAFGLDDKTYEIDLCPEDGTGLTKVAAGYISQARKAVRAGRRDNSRRPRSRGAPAAAGAGARPAGKKGSARGEITGATQVKAQAGPPQRRAAKATGVQQEKGIYIYGVLPADIEVTAEMTGVGEHPGPLDVVRANGLAALISVVDEPGRLGSSEDRRTHRQILDSTAIEVPVLPLRFGTVLANEGAVVDELLTPRHEAFAAALEQLEGCAEFLVKGRYLEEATPGEAVTAKREEDTRALRQAMEAVCVASVVQEPTRDRDAFGVAFLVAVDEESEVERVIEDLAREWEGRIEVRLRGPMAAYDFARGLMPGPSRPSGRSHRRLRSR